MTVLNENFFSFMLFSEMEYESWICISFNLKQYVLDLFHCGFYKNFKMYSYILSKNYHFEKDRIF